MFLKEEDQKQQNGQRSSTSNLQPAQIFSIGTSQQDMLSKKTVRAGSVRSKQDLKNSISNNQHSSGDSAAVSQNNRAHSKPRISQVSPDELFAYGVKPSVTTTQMEIKQQQQDEIDNLANMIDQEGTSSRVTKVTIIWENVLIFTITYNIVTSTYFLGLPGFPSEAWTYLEFLTEIAMVIDIFIRYGLRSLLTSQKSTLNILHDRNDDGLLNMLLFIISSIPSSIILYASLSINQHSVIWFALIRCHKLYRIKQMNRYFDLRDIRAKKDSFIRTIQSLLYILLATHLLSCFWLFIGRVDPEQSNNWMNLVMYDQYEGHVMNIQKYIDSVFFVVSSMTGLGFAYIYPRTSLEYGMQSMIMLLGVSLYANFFAFFTVTIYNRNKRRIENMLKFEENKKMALLRNFPQDIRLQTRIYYNNLRLKYEGLCDKFNILQQLPNSLRSEMSLFINRELIQKINFFQFAEPAFILKLSKSLYPLLGLQDSYVVQQGEVATKLYFIKSGIVQVLATDDKTVIAYMSEGAYFGEIGLLLTHKRTCSVKARTVSIFFTVEKEELMEVLEEFPLHLKYLKAVAKQRIKTTHPEDIADKGNDNEVAHRLQQELDQMNKNQNYTSLFRLDVPQHKLNFNSENNSDTSIIDEIYGEKLRFYLTEPYKNINYFIVIPMSLFFKIWSLVFLASHIYNILYVPFSIGLDFEFSGHWYILEGFILLVTLADSLLRPFLAVNKRIEIETDRDTLFKIYIHKYFIFDVLSSIPFDYLILIIEHSVYVRYFRLLRLLKIYRLFEIVSIIRQHTTINVPIFRLSILFFSFILISHWFNCILILFGKWELNQNRRFDGKTLLGWLEKSSSVELPPIEQWTPWQYYSNLLILSTCFMGSIMYGDIIPFTLSEETVSIFQMILGRMFIAFLFAEMSSYVQQQYSAFDRHMHQRNLVLKWVQLNGINENLRSRIIKYFDYQWHHQKGVKEEELIDDLPPALKKSVKKYIFEELMMNCDVFPRDSPGAIATICRRLIRKLIPKDEFVIKQGELAKEMYFIMKGEVRVVTQEGVTLATLKKNMHFGEMALIHDQISVRSTSVIANVNTTVAILTVKDFQLICNNYPEFKTRMQLIVAQRSKDAQEKGANISNQAKGIENKELKRFLTNSMNNAATNNNYTLQQRQLSIVQEESRRGNSANDDQSVQDANFVSPRHELHQKIFKKQASKFRFQKKNCITKINIQTSPNPTTPEQFFVNALINTNGGQNQYQDSDESFSSHSSYLSSSERQEEIKQSNEEESKQRPSGSQQSNAIASEARGSNSLNNIENMRRSAINRERLSRLSVSDQTNGHQHSADDIHSNRNHNQDDPLYCNTQRELQTNGDLLTSMPSGTTLPTPLKPVEGQLKQNNPARLNQLPKISSSMSNFEEYLMQFRGSQGSIRVTFTTMFIFYAFKYLLIFPLSFYNLIFIPLQMAFSIQFKGWYLFAEILTLITYSIDIFFIARHYFQLRKQYYLFSLPSESFEHQLRLDHDRDEIEMKLKSARFDLITSVLGMLPFSLIFEQITSMLFIVNFLRVLRLVKILPLQRILNYLKRYNVNLVRLFEIILAYYIVAHIVGCVMISVGLAKKDRIYDTWMNKIPVPLPPDMPKQTNIDSVSWSTIYIHAIYFSSNTISHVAIGDLTSVTMDERMLNVFIIWCFTFFYSLLFANISSIFNEGNNFLSFHQKYQYVMNTIPKDKMGTSIMQQINSYYEYLWSVAQGFDEERDVLRSLPSQIMYDAFRERFQEAIESSMLFKNQAGELDIAILNSFIELIQVRIYMPKEFIIKAGSHDLSLYMILEGEAVMFGISNDILAVMRCGAHFNTDIGTGDNSPEIYYGKRIVHLVSLSQTTVAVLDKSHLEMLFGAFPFWKTIVRKLNCHTHFKAKGNLEEYLAPLVRIDPYANEFEIELQAIENHLAKSDIHTYEKIVSILDEPQNHYLFDPDCKDYQKIDLINEHILVLEKEVGIKQDHERLSKQGSFHRRHLRRASSSSHIEFAQMQSLRRLNIEQSLALKRSSKKRRLCDFMRYIYFNRISKTRTFIEFLHMLNIIYIAVAVPFTVAFYDSLDLATFVTFEGLSVLIQILVIFVNFRTPVLYIGGNTLDFCQVLKNYWHNGLIIDLMGALPLNLILEILQQTEPSIILISLFKITRLIAILRLLELFEKFQIYLKNQSVFMVIMKAFLFLMILWHWTSCAWYFINQVEYNSYQLTWFKQFSVKDHPIAKQYLLSIYYVIKIVTGVGQSDMIAYNDLERIIFILIINIGDALFAIAFGLLAELQKHIFENSEFQKYLSKMKEIEEFIVNVEAEDNQRNRVEQYFQYTFFTKNKKHMIEAKDLDEYLPYSLRKEVIYLACRELLNPMFKDFQSENLIRELSYVLQNTTYMPGDYVILKDQIGEEMFFIIEGTVQVIAGDKSTVINTLGKGSYFGEIAIFMRTKRTAYVQAKTFCNISILKKSDIEEIILNFPSLQIKFEELSKQRMQQSKQFEQNKMVNNLTHNESEEESDNDSFLKALQQNALDAESLFTSGTHQSLLQNIKRQADNNPMINQFLTQTGVNLQIPQLIHNSSSMMANSVLSPAMNVDLQQNSSPKQKSASTQALRVVPSNFEGAAAQAQNAGEMATSVKTIQRQSQRIRAPSFLATGQNLGFGFNLRSSSLAQQVAIQAALRAQSQYLPQQHLKTDDSKVEDISDESKESSDHEPENKMAQVQIRFNSVATGHDSRSSNMISTNSVINTPHRKPQSRGSKYSQPNNPNLIFAETIQDQSESISVDQSMIHSENPQFLDRLDSLQAHASPKLTVGNTEQMPISSIRNMETPEGAMNESPDNFFLRKQQQQSRPNEENMSPKMRNQAIISPLTEGSSPTRKSPMFGSQPRSPDSRISSQQQQMNASVVFNPAFNNSGIPKITLTHFPPSPVMPPNTLMVLDRVNQKAQNNRRMTMQQLSPEFINLIEKQQLAIQNNLIPPNPDGVFTGSNTFRQQTLEDEERKASRKHSIMLFKQAIEAAPVDVISQGSGPQAATIRRKGGKKIERRLSKIQLGKNLMLNNQSGLKLQWTVGN